MRRAVHPAIRPAVHPAVWRHGANAVRRPPFSPFLGLELEPDYVADAALGDDGNTGAPGDPVRTLGALASLINANSAPGGRLVARVRRATYTNQEFNPQMFSGELDLVIEPGTEVVRDNGADGNAISLISGVTRIYGNGSTVDGYNVGTGNGVSTSGSAVCEVHDLYATDCVDGFSPHQESTMILYRCSALDCIKSGIGAVNDSTLRAYNCIAQLRDAEEGSLGAFVCRSSVVATVEDCTFLPNADGSKGKIEGSYQGLLTARFKRCRIGSLTEELDLEGGDYEDCFVNGYCEFDEPTNFTRCFGYYNNRMRYAGGGGLGSSVDRCHWAGPADPQRSMLWTNFAPSSPFAPFAMTNSLVHGYATAVDFGGNSARLQAWQDGDCAIDQCAFYGNTADFESLAQQELGMSITSITTSNPAAGAGGSYDMADWACSDGVHGFTANEVVPIGATLTDFPPAWLPEGAIGGVDFTGDRAYVAWASYSSIADLLASSRADFVRDSAALGRDSAGAYTQFAAGALRLTDLGAVIEPSVENLMTQSAPVDHSPIGASLTSVDGWTEIVETAADSEHSVFAAANFTVGETYTVQVEFAALAGSSTRYLALRGFGLGGNYPIVDLVTGAVVQAGTQWESVTVHELASGLYRLVAVCIPTSTAAPIFHLQTVADFTLGSRSYQGDGSSGMRLRHAALIAGDHPDGFEPVVTSGAPATRPADALSLAPGAGTYDITVTFDDDSTQVLSGVAIPASGWAVPTDLGRAIIKRITWAAA